MGKIFVVRHGEIDLNAQERYAGCLDVELNKNGLRQTRDIVEDIGNLKIDLIISSPLKRCQYMAEAVSRAMSLPVITMAEFRERGVGIFEGLTRDEARIKYPEFWARNITRIYNDAPPGGETIKQVEERVFVGLKEICKKYNNRNVLIVTHAFIGRMINKFFNNITEEQFFAYKLGNAKIAEYICS